MEQKRIGVYAGSFDPLTNGHLWMIEEGAKIFDGLIVAIGVNPAKRYLFTLEERLDILKSSVDHISNVSVESFNDRFLVDWASERKARFILRGIRSATDFEFERAVRYINADRNGNITTVFLMPPRELADVSSSMVKGLASPDGWEGLVAKYVPNATLEKLKEKTYGKR